MASAGLAVVALAAAGVTAGALLAPQSIPASVASPSGDRTVAVGTEVFEDARTLTVRPEVVREATLTVPDTGRVVRSVCAPGATLASGATPLTVDGRPVVALATEIPLWRDLEPGARGEDVEALQTELARLGHPVTADGVYGPATRTAVRDVMHDAGVARPTGGLRLASVMWLPAPEVTLESCEVAVGDDVAAGPFAAIAGGLVALQVTDGLTGAAPGERVVTYGGVSASMSPEGVVTDAELLAAVAAGSEYQQATSGDGAATFTLPSTLAQAQEVAVVAPAALYGLDGSQGCVLSDDGARAVTVVSSALGQSMVTFDDGAPAERVHLDVADDVRERGCR